MASLVSVKASLWIKTPLNLAQRLPDASQQFLRSVSHCPRDKSFSSTQRPHLLLRPASLLFNGSLEVLSSGCSGRSVTLAKHFQWEATRNRGVYTYAYLLNQNSTWELPISVHFWYKDYFTINMRSAEHIGLKVKLCTCIWDAPDSKLSRDITYNWGLS